MGIFKGYDIRGIYPDEINEKKVYAIAVAAAKFLKAKEILLGRDVRNTSDLLFAAAAEGLTNHGVKVIDIGVCSTPMFNFASGYYKKPAIMITASHNPPEFNGMKISRAGAVALSYESGIGEIEKISAEISEEPKKIKKSELVQKDIEEDYVSYVSKFVRDIKGLKVVVDAGNGSAALTVPLVMNNFEAEIVELFFDIDGNFPGRGPNPMLDETLCHLQEKVKKEKADLGVAFDADADRIRFVDEKGEIIQGDIITALVAKEILSSSPGERIIYDLRSSRVVGETIKEAGGEPIMFKVGHSYIKEGMREHNAVFGGEMSAHYYFKDYFYADSGIIAMIKIMNLVKSSGKRLSALVAPLRKYSHTGEVNFKVEEKDKKIAEIESHFKDADKILHMDGTSIYYEDWWFNLRKSNTEPFLRLNLEAGTEKLMKEKLKLLTCLIEG